ncbi:MAG: 3-hydroxyacyl-CoA dehydrogenase family protein [Hyphomicrobiaceae bacterium]
MGPRIIANGVSRSFPGGDPFLASSDEASDVAVVLGPSSPRALDGIDIERYRTILVELDGECLGTVTGENFGREGSKVLGFARYSTGSETPTNVIELVVQPRTDPQAREAAIALFEAAGLVVVVCNDRPGRILDRLMRPYFNRALDALDRGLASAEGLDQALTLGLGYRRGPIAILTTSGLAHHAEVSSLLHAAFGEPSYLPARRARVAAAHQVETS